MFCYIVLLIIVGPSGVTLKFGSIAHLLRTSYKCCQTNAPVELQAVKIQLNCHVAILNLMKMCIIAYANLKPKITCGNWANGGCLWGGGVRKFIQKYSVVLEEFIQPQLN